MSTAICYAAEAEYGEKGIFYWCATCEVAVSAKEWDAHVAANSAPRPISSGDPMHVGTEQRYRIRELTLTTLREVIASDPYHGQFQPLLDEIDGLRQELAEAHRKLELIRNLSERTSRTGDGWPTENWELRKILNDSQTTRDNQTQA